MNRRGFLLSSAALLLPSRTMADPASAFASPPVGYSGPFRAWGPTDDRDTGRHDWISEIVPTIDGPFTKVRPHAIEWWNGE